MCLRKQVHVKINGVEIAPKQVMCTGEDIHAMQRCLGAADAHVDWDMVCGKTVSSLAGVTMASVAAGLCHKVGIGASLLFCCTMALHYSLFGKKLRLRKRATAATHALDALVPCFKRNRARILAMLDVGTCTASDVEWSLAGREAGAGHVDDIVIDADNLALVAACRCARTPCVDACIVLHVRADPSIATRCTRVSGLDVIADLCRRVRLARKCLLLRTGTLDTTMQVRGRVHHAYVFFFAVHEHHHVFVNSSQEIWDTASCVV